MKQNYFKGKPVRLITRKPDQRGYVCIEDAEGNYLNVHQTGLTDFAGERKLSAWWNGGNYIIREDRSGDGKPLDCRQVSIPKGHPIVEQIRSDLL